MTHPAMKVDGSQLVDILALLGANDEPAADNRAAVESLEQLLGKPLPAESRSFLLNPVPLFHPDAEHPGCHEDFLSGLPDVGAFLDHCMDADLWAQAHFNAICHFLGLYPLGSQLQYGDIQYALALLEPHSEGLGGVMYYDEREVGGWASSISEFLLQSVAQFWEECDGEVDEDEEDQEIDLYDLRDCFIFEDYDWRVPAPEQVELPSEITTAFETVWRDRMELLSRLWVAAFLRGRFESYQLSDLPTPEQWAEQREQVRHTHHDAMYWLFAHMLLDNRDELAECIALCRENPSQLVAAVADYFEADSELADRWKPMREKVFAMTREARASG